MAPDAHPTPNGVTPNNQPLTTRRLRRQAHRIRLEAAKARAAAPRKGARRLDPAKTLQQPADRNLRLHAGERHAGAGVNAGAEGEVAIRLPTDIEAIWIG